MHCTALYGDNPVASSQQETETSSAGRIFVALDFPDLPSARETINTLAPLGVRFKIGLQLLTLLGKRDIAELNVIAGGLFLDFKLHDIARTVRSAVRSIAQLDPAFVTVIGEPHVMRAAVEGKADNGLRLLGVTVLTSLDDADLREGGYALSSRELVMKRAFQACEAGMDGLICSPHEVAIIREAVGDDLCLITPGVRPLGSEAGDQKRVMTPSQAISNGADYLVIGRPIVGAQDPFQAAQRLIADLDAAL